VTLRLNQLRIGGRILAGFVLTIALIVLVAGFGIFELSSIGGHIGRLTAVSESLDRTLQVGRDAEVMRVGSLRYKAAHDPAAIAQFNDAHKRIVDRLTDGAKATQSDERRRMYATGAQAAELAQQRFDEMAKVVDDFLQGQKALFTTGDELNAAAHRAIEAAENSKQQDAIMAARDLDIALNVMRVTNWRFQATGDQAGIALFKSNVQKANAAIDQFEKVADESTRAHLGALRASIKSYDENFTGISAAMLKADDLFRKQVLPAINDLYNMTVAAEASLRSDMEQTKEKADTGATLGIVLSLLLSVAAIVTGMALAYFIGRGISRPLTALTEGMHELAAGKFDIVLPGLGRPDEIGEIAGAIETFKVKAAEKANQEADEILRRQKAEAEAQAAAAAERAKVAEEHAKAEAEAQAAIAAERAKAAEQHAKAAEEQGRAMRGLAEGLDRLAQGDLTFRLSEGFTDAYKQIKDDFNLAIGRLQETVTSITRSTRDVSGAAAEISSSTSDLSQRTEEQAASLEETSAAMEEMSATVKKNAENAQAANQSAAGTRDVAGHGGQVVAKAVDAMARIEESSRKISDIIGVIDEIARQTNLLALNAAVEAARAGEAGRGFAVVASEVRSLAQRSSQAAKDIKGLITNSNSQVKDGVDLVNKAGTALNEIVESAKKVADIIADIATASAEQAAGIEQVNRALTQMDEVTQQNSALVEENAATAKTLEQQARAMSTEISFFHLGDATTDVMPSGRVAPPPAAMAAKVVENKPVAAKPAAAARNAGNGSGKVAAARGGPVGRMQAVLATAVNDPDWREF
jgi:methyl-accepting chemotaxis protein